MKFPAYPRCSVQSRARWLGEIPDHWEVKRLKFIFPRLFSGVSVNSDNFPSLDGSIAILKTSCVYGNRFNPEENKRVVETEIDRVTCPATRDSLIISRMNTPELVGNCGYVDRDYENLFLPDRLWIARFSNHPDANGKFAWYLVISHALASLTGVLATGTSDSMKNLTQEAFLDICVGVPTASEQQQITAFLDWKTAQIDALIARKQDLLETLNEKRLAVITQAVTRGLNPTVPLRESGLPWLGQVPEHWEVRSLKFCFESLNNRRIPLSSEDRANMSRDYPYYGASGVIDYVEDYIFDEPLILIGEDGANLLSRSTPLAFEARGKYWVNNHAHILRPILGPFAYWSNLLCIVQYAPWITGAAQPKLTKENLGSVPLPCPPRAEQDAIAEFIEQETGKIDPLINLARHTIERLAEYRTALITAATTGKIDVRNIKIPHPFV